MRFNESDKLKLEENCIPVNSIINKKVIFAVRKDGQGMHILFGPEETIIHADNIPILQEALEVWELHRRGVS